MKHRPMRTCLAAAALGGLLWAQQVLAHTFPERAEPRVGAVIDSSPSQVRIWFDGQIEPAFSTLRVLDGQGRQVNQEAGQVDPAQPRLLEARLPPLSPGAYHVFWRVIARDGHVTEGDYVFTVRR
ncbi:copper resistance protein CopC [Undibacterium arcticum]|uniref:Copper resistance protein CopC n=1 Tax=Undibacterium arcticum TaxID=1762892 RepID=A0ABV7F6A0_9BURK